MNNELQQKLYQLIEANFSKMESDALTKLVSEHETFKAENLRQDEQIKDYANKLDRLERMVEKLDIEEKNLLKEVRNFKWRAFNELDSEQKFSGLSVIIARKKDKPPHLAINLRNFGSNFDSIIFELISKAQCTPDNYYRLMLAFPEYVMLWEEWQNAENEEEFFKKYGV